MTPGVRSAVAVVALATHGVRRRPLSSALTALAVALGVALVIGVDTLRRSTERSFQDAARGYDLIVGPLHGSPLQIVLSTLFHLDEAGGTVPWAVYEELQADPRVRAAIPYAMGDTYRGHRVVGTTGDVFDVLTGADDRPLGEGLRGRAFLPRRFEAVVGSAVAQATGLSVGADFQVSHGLVESPHLHDERWTVVGVLRPTGMTHDRAIYIPIESFYAIPGHDAEPGSAHPAREEHDDHDEQDGHEEPTELDGHSDPDAEAARHAPDSHDRMEHSPTALSSVGLRLHVPGLRLQLRQEIRTTRTDAQAVLPADRIRDLMAIVGDVNSGARLVAWLVAVVAALSILVGLYEAILSRRREIAVLRALGARPVHVFGVIVLEALFLCLIGAVGGLVLGHGALAAAAPALLERFGIRVAVGPTGLDLQVLLAVLGLGLLAGILPAWRGLTTPVAQNL